MTTPRIEEMVEDLIKEFSTTELVLDTTDEYYIKGTSGDFADALKHALTQAHQAGIDEALALLKAQRDKVLTSPEEETAEEYGIRLKAHNQALDDTIKALQDKK